MTSGTDNDKTQDLPVLEWTTARAPGGHLAPQTDYVEVLHSACPMRRVRIWDGTEPWLITKHEQYRQVISDQRFSADKTRPGYPLKNAGHQGRPRSFLHMDDPEHMQYRRVWARNLSAHRAESLRPQIQAVVDECLDAMLSGPMPVDFIKAFALPVPAMMLSAVFGIPPEDRKRFLRLSSVMTSATSTKEEAAAAVQALYDYADTLVAQREKEPLDDVVTDFLEHGIASGVFTRDEVVRAVAGMVAQGHDTSLSIISLGTLALMQHPDQMAEFHDRCDDEKFVANAIEELLRFLAPTQTGRRRVATADIEIGGNLIRAGEGIIALDNTSSRDPDVFADPDRLILDRPEARKHNAFGFGTHQCVGQSLARVELQTVFATLCRRVPTIRLAVDEEELTYREDLIVYEVDEMPVEW